jgi:uncharacterized membrane protein YbhN (UPF0104 family)
MPSRTVLRWIGALVGLLVLGLVLQQLHAHRSELDQAWLHLRVLPLLFSFALLFLAQALFALSWHRLLHAAGETGNFSGDAARWGVSLAGKYFPGKVWQALARFGLYHGAPRGSRVAPAFLREMLLSVSAAMSIVAVQSSMNAGHLAPLAWPFGLGAVMLLVLALPPVARTAMAWLRRWTPLRLESPASDAGSLPLAWCLQLAAYLLMGLGCFVLGQAFGLLAADMIFPAIAGLCFAGLAGIAAFFVPAGLGVREAALAWFLAPWLGPAPALLLAVLARLWISLGEATVIAGGLLWLRAQGDSSKAPESAS